MGQVNPLEQAFVKVGLAPQSVMIVLGLSFIVGVMESSMQPFESPVYIGAMALVYAASTQWGLMDGVFVASGVIALLFFGSIFRADASLHAFISELPADLLLFGGLGILPGLAVEITQASTKEMDAERGGVKRKISELNNRLGAMGKEMRAKADSTKDDGRWNKRGNQLVDASRRMVAAESVTAVLEVLSGTLEDALQPARAFIAVADGEGGLAVSRVEPPVEGDPAPIPLDDSAVREVVRGNKPMAFASVTAVGGDGLGGNLLVPVILNKQLIALIGLEVAEAAARDELDFATILAHLAQEVSGRFSLPA